MVSTPPKHHKDTPPLSPPFTSPARAGVPTVQTFLQPNALQNLLKQQHHPPDILSNLLSAPTPAAAAAAAAATLTQQGEVAQRLAAVFQATIAAQQAAAAAHQVANSGVDQPENLSSSSSPKKRCTSSLSPTSNNNNNNNNTSTLNDSTMKVPPISLPNSHGQLPMPFSADFLWRFPNPYLPQPPPSPLESQMKNQLPGGLGHDPRCWTREDVMVFLRYCEREFDLDKIDLDKFQMNGKAICLLGKSDLAERCSGAGDVIHNILQMLIRETSCPFPPSSPLTPRPPLMTPTSPAIPLSPHPWPLLTAAAQAAQAVASDTFPNLSHLISSANSVTLSPAPSIDSQNGGGNGTSPRLSSSLQQHLAGTNGSANGEAGTQQPTSIHQLYPAPSGRNNAASIPPLNGNTRENLAQTLTNGGYNHQSSGNKRSHSASSSHSDSEDSSNTASPDGQVPGSSSSRLVDNNNAQLLSRSRRTPSSNAGGANNSSVSGRSPTHQAKNEPSSSTTTKEPDTPELNTNGRLLWDFLQQLLNDSQQRYTSYIAWKNKDTGVFKIVDPSGLARLWGIQKNHLSMNYDKMSRALRYYYRVNILRKVQGERHCYQFLRNPSELKSIKNISLLRQQMEAQAAAHKLAAQHIATLRGLSPQGSAALSSLAAAGAALVSQQESATGISAQAAAAAAAAGLHDSSDLGPEEDEGSPNPTTDIAGHHQTSNSDEPTDLTLDAGEKARLRERLEREHRSFLSVTTTATKIPQQTPDEEQLRDREQLDGRAAFDFRRLMPQSMPVKSENC